MKKKPKQKKLWASDQSRFRFSALLSRFSSSEASSRSKEREHDEARGTLVIPLSGVFRDPLKRRVPGGKRQSKKSEETQKSIEFSLGRPPPPNSIDNTKKRGGSAPCFLSPPSFSRRGTRERDGGSRRCNSSSSSSGDGRTRAEASASAKRSTIDDAATAGDALLLEKRRGRRRPPRAARLRRGD